jgi:hypothetical protein
MCAYQKNNFHPGSNISNPSGPPLICAGPEAGAPKAASRASNKKAGQAFACPADGENAVKFAL